MAKLDVSQYFPRDEDFINRAACPGVHHDGYSLADVGQGPTLILFLGKVDYRWQICIDALVPFFRCVLVTIHNAEQILREHAVLDFASLANAIETLAASQKSLLVAAAGQGLMVAQAFCKQSNCTLEHGVIFLNADDVECIRECDPRLEPNISCYVYSKESLLQARRATRLLRQRYPRAKIKLLPLGKQHSPEQQAHIMTNYLLEIFWQ